MVLLISSFKLANKCASSGTAVTRRIVVGADHRFRFSSTARIAISGSVYREFNGAFFSKRPYTGAANGTVRTRNGARDSGTLKFTAMLRRRV